MEFLVNDERVDRAHRIILQLFDSFGALPPDVSAQTILDLLERLREHVTEHFAEEQQIFEQELEMDRNYVNMHKSDHERLRGLVEQTIESYRAGTISSVDQTLSELRDEIRNHILEIDVLMAEADEG